MEVYIMSKQIVGATHTAHETRHLPRKMELVRQGKLKPEELESLLQKISDERESLIEKYEDCCSELRIEPNMQQEVHRLTVEEAKKFEYIEGLEPQDFLFISKLETHYQYGTPAPQREHLHTGTMLLQACINELTWAREEILAHKN